MREAAASSGSEQYPWGRENSLFRLSEAAARRLGIGVKSGAKAKPRRRIAGHAYTKESPAWQELPEPCGEIALVIAGRPMAKEAPRSGGGRFYKPRRTSDFERQVRDEARLVMRGYRPFAGPVGIEIVHYRKLLKRFSRAERAAALAGEILPDTKPDGDNIEKSVFDGLKTVVFEDDAQLCWKTHIKLFGESERVEVRVWALPARAIRRKTGG